MNRFSIEMLPAREGDCLWIEYGEPSAPNRLLIDGGTSGTYKEIQRKIKELEEPKVHFDLLVITHVDSDHIGGALKLLKSPTISVDEVWFNGFRHLPGPYKLYGPVQGEKLSKTIGKNKIPWNKTSFKGKSVSVPEEGDLLVIPLPGGMKLTLFSPYFEQLAVLRPVWQEACREAGLDPSHLPLRARRRVERVETSEPLDVEALAKKKFEPDTSEANGSSIAFLAEYGGKRALLAGDAYPEKLVESIERFEGSEKSKLKIDAFKLPHHGSKYNIDKKLLQKVDCGRYLLSTDGNIHGHPDREAIARILKFGGPNAELIFNYSSEFTQVWDDSLQKQKYGYSTVYPVGEEKGKVVNLL